MILVDSGHLMALAEPRDALHYRAVRWSENISQSLVITEYVLLEMMNALSAPIDRPKAHALASQMLGHEHCEFLHASPELWKQGLALHRQRPDKAWSLTDCISFCVMRDWQISAALSHDVHFEQAGFVALLRREP